MFKAIGNFFREVFGTPSKPVFDHVPDKIEPPIVHLGPEKVEQPAPVKCGCGRSPTGFCVGLHKLSEAEWSVHADNPNKVVAEAPKAKQAKPKKERAPKAEKAAKVAAPKAEKKPRKTAKKSVA